MPDFDLIDQSSPLHQSANFLDEQSLHSVHLCRVSLAPVTEVECVQLIADAIDTGCGGWCVTVNLENLRKTAANPELQRLVESSTLRVADGITLVWASWLRGVPLPERVCGSNLIYSLTDEAAKRGLSVFLLGGNEGTADRAAEILRQRNRGLKIAGTLCPPVGFERDLEQVEKILEILRRAQPDIIYVAVGFPKSERLIARIRHVCPNAWWLGVGISFSYVTQDIKRPPRWAQNLGFETLYRLLQEPQRLARRYLLDGPPFAAKLLLLSLVQRFTDQIAASNRR
ncbi:MAG: WecB/TagA/CpsF family glycosyltransferase [Oscillatoriales cyanobacterium C42_A2020_001]|nr:WecB/TagA/CpsF family glycosyltransferase [Leptolyngbyaceae cyanobacterium C42_A2020_001]